MKPLDLTGQMFGDLTVLERVYVKGPTRWLCRCKCGETLVVYTTNLRRGLSGSCGGKGCRLGKRTHGGSRGGSPLYSAWQNIIQRTTNPNNTNYPYYGGRGITVCDEWRDFAKFEAYVLSELGPRTEGMTFDRIDVNGNYEPGNIRWATKSEQRSNSRDSRKYTGEVCSFPGCGRRKDGHGLCQSHRRQQAKGEELRPIRPKRAVS